MARRCGVIGGHWILAGASAALVAVVAVHLWLLRRTAQSGWAEFEAHRRSVRDQQDEVRRRGEKIDRQIARGVRPEGERFEL